MRDGTPWINSPFLVTVANTHTPTPASHLHTPGLKEHRVSDLLSLPRILSRLEPVNQMWRPRVLFLCSMRMQIYWVDKLEVPIKDDHITVIQCRDTQTSRAGFHKRKDTQPPKGGTCGPCFELPYSLGTPGEDATAWSSSSQQLVRRPIGRLQNTGTKILHLWL